MSNIDKRIKVNTIIENQLPEFLVSDFPNATEFLKQYYIELKPWISLLDINIKIKL